MLARDAAGHATLAHSPARVGDFGAKKDPIGDVNGRGGAKQAEGCKSSHVLWSEPRWLWRCVLY